MSLAKGEGASRIAATAMLLWVLACATVGAGESREHSERPDEPPNIIVILCDDLGYGDLQCYGHPHIETPHLDALAEGGIRLTDCYSAAPVCSPSRVGLLTGRSPNRAGVYDWIPPASRPRPDARDQVHMRATEVTIPMLMKEAGYRTCMSGKWHCNSRFNSDRQPQPGDFGFDHWFGTQNNASPTHENPTNYVRNGEPVGAIDGFSCQIAVDEVIGWLDDTSSQETPFFVYLAFHEPHEPVASPRDLLRKYESVADSEDEAQYFANVENVDRAVGRLMQALEERDARENTLVIFTSDNGPETLNRYRNANRSFGTPGPLRGMKLHTHDAGFRVAGIINWPAQIAAGQLSSVPISALDFLPTFCELAGADAPRGVELDGTSIATFLSDGELDREKPLIWAYYNAINQARVAMRHGKWKVLAQLNGGQTPRFPNLTPERLTLVGEAELTNFEVYDLSADIGEQSNLADDDRQEVKDAIERLVREYRNLVAHSHAWTPTQDR